MIQAEQTNNGPVDAPERSALLDSLRGWALFGILLANMMAFIGFGMMPSEQRTGLLLAPLNDVTEFVAEWLVVGKFYALFSLLFGIGFAIQIGRLEQRGEGAGRYARRLAILFVIGLSHMLLLWHGDILALYALMGCFLLLFRRLRDPALLWWAIILWLIPLGWSAMIHFGGFRPDGPLTDFGDAMVIAAGFDPVAGPVAFFRDSSFLETLAVNPGTMVSRIAGLLYQMRFTKVLGMFLLGLWIGRRAIHANPSAYLPLLRRVARWGLWLGLPLAAVKAILTMWPEKSPIIMVTTELFYVISTPILALGYAGAFTLLWIEDRARITEWAAPAGRMALTNYLMQTLLQSAIFYGWGLSLIGTLGLVFILPISVALFALQVVYSRWWLERFRFGPMEWLWRSGTYGELQPLRRVPRPATRAD